jgi:hypothetical protein
MLLYILAAYYIGGYGGTLYEDRRSIMIQNIIGVKEAGAYATVALLKRGLELCTLVIVTSLFPAILNARRDDTGAL